MTAGDEGRFGASEVAWPPWVSEEDTRSAPVALTPEVESEFPLTVPKPKVSWQKSIFAEFQVTCNRAKNSVLSVG